MHEKKLFIILALLIVGATFGSSLIAFADFSDLFGSIASLPGRDRLPEVPNLDMPLPLDPQVASQQGARRLQGLNPNQAANPDTITQLINETGAENTNPNRLANALPTSLPTLNNIINTQSNSNGTPFSAGGRNATNDRLGSNVNNGEQSTVTRNGSLPNNAVTVTGGDPAALARLLSASANADIRTAYNNYLATVLAIKLQVINTKTGHLADKYDELNQKHRELNETTKELAETMNRILQQLATLPKT